MKKSKKMQEWSVGLRLMHGENYGPDTAEKRLDDLADYFPVISLGPKDVTFRLTVSAVTPEEALTRAIQVVGAGVYLSINVMTVDELEREIEKPTVPDLVSAAEIGEMAGVSRQRADQWADSSDFPPPAVTTRAGRLWLRVSVNRWLERTPRRVGRPRTPQPAQKRLAASK